jgi:hypothetical protein
MRIDSENNFLSIERVGQEGSTVVWRMVAAAANDGCFAAVCSRAKVHTTDETSARIAKFAAGQAQRFELMLSRSGWLRIRRGHSGRTLVRYRLGQWGAGASLEGKVCLEGESATAFCRELRGLL